MTLSKLARILGKTSIYARDINAVKRGRIGQRITNRIIGRIVNKGMKNVWR